MSVVRYLALSSSVVLAVLVALGQIYLQPLVEAWGILRPVEPAGTRDCIKVRELQACEKISLHAPSGILYLACSTPRDRLNWVNWLPDVAQRSTFDYLATYDASTNTFQRLSVTGNAFDIKRTVSFQGMDVVTSARDTDEVFVYLVNHRLPEDIQDFVRAGPDSVLEIFKTRVGSGTLQHLHTFRDDNVIVAPVGVSGSSDGKSVYFTNNDRGKLSEQFSFKRIRSLFHPSSSVGLCHVDKGCFIAAKDMQGNHGLVRASSNNTLYVGNSVNGGIHVMGMLDNGTLVLQDTIGTPFVIDSLTVDQKGHIYAAAFPRSLDFFSCMDDFSLQCRPASAVFVTTTNATGAYNVANIFEDDGTLVWSMTAVAHDAARGRLFMHGLLAPWLTVCKV
ncbi:hypothetical protein AURDEDRAFT_145403 [Auricularia subglabra TFB-10046 SS5]|nr:hypothetical protein AURDEDRAFT_145403 [Auricularia subglabra TFB-10046 SS5]